MSEQRKKQFIIDAPRLMEEWDWEKNSALGIFPETTTTGTSKKAWWICKKCKHRWEAKILNRYYGRNCPVCAGKIVVQGKNDLATLRPELAEEWDFDSNDELTPYDVTVGCGKKIHWICHLGHKYTATILHRAGKHGTNCPVCHASRQTSFAEQAFFFYIKQLYPDAVSRYKDIFNNGMELDIYIPSWKIAVEFDGIFWHKKRELEIKTKREELKYQICKQHGIRLFRLREGEIEQSNVYADSWYPIKASNNFQDLENCIRSFILTFNPLHINPKKHSLTIDLKRDEPAIRASYMTEFKKNSLQTQYPLLAKEWHSTKNGALLPSMFLCGSSYRAYWKCSICGNEWQASIGSRTKGRRCQKCFRKANKGGGHPEARPIYQYTKDGTFIKKWDSIMDASRALQKNSSNITSCAKHDRPYAAGFRWEYDFQEYLEPVVKKKKSRKGSHGKAIYQVDKNGQIIAEYPSLSEASAVLQIDATSISKVLNGHQQTAGGYLWRFK